MLVFIFYVSIEYLYFQAVNVVMQLQTRGNAAESWYDTLTYLIEHP